MAIESNASTEEVLGGIKVYSGLTNVNIIAVNPTMEELHALDINVKQEQSYTVTIGEREFNKVCFWVNNEDGNYKIEFLLQPEERVSQNGKNEWINSIGQSTWSTEEPSYDWWKSEGQRKAYVGEITLMDFIKAWANVASGGQVTLDTIDNIVRGDVAELKTLVTALKGNQVRVLIGVKDGKYQQVYTKYFGRIKPQRDDLFVTKLSDDYGAFNADFNADLKWELHTPTINLVTPDSQEADWTMPDTPQNGIPVEEENLFE